jgi:hypothetical protein
MGVLQQNHPDSRHGSRAAWLGQPTPRADKGGLGESQRLRHKCWLMFRALGSAHSPFWSTSLWMRELNLLKVEPRHSYWLKLTRKFCLMSRPGELRGSCGRENYPIRASRRIGNCVKEAIAVMIQPTIRWISKRMYESNWCSSASEVLWVHLGVRVNRYVLGLLHQRFSSAFRRDGFC